MEHPLFQSAREIYCYASFRGEVETGRLMEEAWKSGKRVALPRVRDKGQMDFYYIDSLLELSCGYQGILEPAKDTSRIALPGAKRPSGKAGRRNNAQADSAKSAETLIILPGAAFDREGNRLGYGKGFYDRYLRAHPGCGRIGLAYSVQCMEKIPADPHDFCVEAVITEKGNFMAC